MRYIDRSLEKEVLRASKAFPAILLTGPRRVGKTTLLKKLFPAASYVLLEDPDVISRVRADPRLFIEGLSPPVILDEIQNVPELFNYLRTLIDERPHLFGQWYFTGSQEAPLMEGISESMAGRVAVLHLLSFSANETKKVSIVHGGFPEVLAQPKTATLWFSSYIQTYLERDIRAISAIKDLSTFRRFLSLLAARTGMILNKTDIAAPLGVSVPTLSEWLSILETTGQIIITPPFFENFGKRLIKSPKIYFADSGLVSYLLGIETEAALLKSPFLGQIFEGFVASEIAKHQINTGKRREIYYFRDQQGLEVDFIVPKGSGKLLVIEAKATRTVRPNMGTALTKLSNAISRYKVEKYVVHLNSRGKEKKEALSLGFDIKAVTAKELTACLA
ncbi:ATP-binding protein [Candidatus Saganbacteria bacterium]|nr:ATP-binding protein [Candidatus Saganbacteria bacterium]